MDASIGPIETQYCFKKALLLGQAPEPAITHIVVFRIHLSGRSYWNIEHSPSSWHVRHLLLVGVSKARWDLCQISHPYVPL